MEIIRVVCGFIINEDKVLIAQRSDKDNYGKWEFPGGKIKKGEKIFSSIKREIKEELNLEITPLKEVHRYSHLSFLLIFIECNCSNPKSVKLTEHLNYKWVKLNQLLEFDLLEGDRNFVLDFANK